jgi:hypothetical protein
MQTLSRFRYTCLFTFVTAGDGRICLYLQKIALGYIVGSLKKYTYEGNQY